MVRTVSEVIGIRYKQHNLFHNIGGEHQFKNYLIVLKMYLQYLKNHQICKYVYFVMYYGRFYYYNMFILLLK